LSKLRGRPSVLILVLVAVLALVGCTSSKTTVSADEVIQNALAAQADVDSSHVEITLDATVQGTVSDQALDISLDGGANADIDWANKKMQSHLGMTMAYGTMSFQMSADMYAVDNVSYTQWTMLGTTDNWTKSALPMDFWFTPDSEEFIDSILEVAEAESLPSEKVGGINCYVLQLTPDIEAIQQMLSEQFPEEAEMPNMEDIITNLSFKVWVAKDTSFVTKIEIELSANIPAEVMGTTGTGMDITFNITIEASDFNESVSIELPAEAQNAEWGESPLPLDMFGF